MEAEQSGVSIDVAKNTAERRTEREIARLLG
jgi:hypothetical protein